LQNNSNIFTAESSKDEDGIVTGCVRNTNTYFLYVANETVVSRLGLIAKYSDYIFIRLRFTARCH